MTYRTQTTRETNLRPQSRNEEPINQSRSFTDRLINLGMPITMTLTGPLIYSTAYSDWQNHPYTSTAITILSALPSGLIGLISYTTLSRLEREENQNGN